MRNTSYCLFRHKLYIAVVVFQSDLNLKVKFNIERNNSPSIFLKIKLPSNNPDSRHDLSVVFTYGCAHLEILSRFLVVLIIYEYGQYCYILIIFWNISIEGFYYGYILKNKKQKIIYAKIISFSSNNNVFLFICSIRSKMTKPSDIISIHMLFSFIFLIADFSH